MVHRDENRNKIEPTF